MTEWEFSFFCNLVIHRRNLRATGHLFCSWWLIFIWFVCWLVLFSCLNTKGFLFNFNYRTWNFCQNMALNCILFGIQFSLFFSLVFKNCVSDLLLLFQFFTCDFSETTVIRQVFLILHLLVFFHLLVLYSVLMWVFIFYINDLILNSMYLPPTQVGKNSVTSFSVSLFHL